MISSILTQCICVQSQLSYMFVHVKIGSEKCCCAQITLLQYTTPLVFSLLFVRTNIAPTVRSTNLIITDQTFNSILKYRC